MSLRKYQNYLFEKYKFYDRSKPLVRTGNDFPWQLVADNCIGISLFLNQLKKNSVARKIYSSLTNKPLVQVGKMSWKESILPNLEQLYAVRCMLNDELSRFLYDEAIILRAASYKKFYFSKLYFDDMVQVIHQEFFKQEAFPEHYLGIPLQKLQIILNNNTTSSTLLQLVVAQGFSEILNSYRQYLITREAVDFRPILGDVVFDCGACIGDMSAIFAGFVGKSGQVHAFDPIPLHIRFCDLQSIWNPGLANVFTLNKMAVGKTTKVIDRGSKKDSKNIEPGGLAIESFDMTSLDDYASKNRISKLNFIKMDIEGSEADAIDGAANIIREFKPKLAISTYHKPDDFWSIPMQIAKLNPSYRFAFGHHSPVHWESVIYAY